MGIGIKRTIATSLVLLGVILVYFSTGCAQTGSIDHWPVDGISRKVKKEVGKDFGFHQRSNYGEGIVRYDFEIMTFDASAIGEFLEACNAALPKKERKIMYSVCFYFPGGFASMFTAKNFNDEGKIYEGCYYLRIKDQTDFNEASCDPTLYSEIEGIKELHVDKAIQDKADEMGVDWYSYWPELEKVVVEGE